MYLGQEKSFMFLRFKLAKSRGLQCYDDKLVQIRIETIDYYATNVMHCTNAGYINIRGPNTEHYALKAQLPDKLCFLKETK